MSTTHTISLFGSTYQLNLYDPNTLAARGFATTAEQASAEAQLAETGAEAALAATLLAALTGPPYGSTSAGLAAVAEGATFFALSGGTIGFYTKTSGVAVATSLLLSLDKMIVPMPALSGGGGSSRIALEFTAPSGMTNSAGGNDAVPVRMNNIITRFDTGPTGMETYYNSTIGFGTNINANFTAANTANNVGMGSASLRIESAFIQPDGIAVSKAAEFHHSIFGLDGLERRPISVYAPFDETEYVTGSIVSTKSGRMLLQDGNGRDRVQFDFRASSNSVSVNGDGVSLGHPVFTFDTNNRFVARQRNAAGSAFIPLPLINANDNIEITGGAIYIAGPLQATPAGETAHLTLLATSGAADQSSLRVLCPAITGSFFADSFSGSASVRLIRQLYNGGAGAGVIDIQSLNGSANDGVLAFSNVGVGGQSWTIGRDNSDGNKLKFESSYLTVGDAASMFMEMDVTAGVVRFGRAAVLRAYTVGALPNPTTVGAGGQVYCTNETGGAVVVFSDGTNWRRVTDRAIAA